MCIKEFKKETGYLKMLIAVVSCIDLLIYMMLWSCFLKISVAVVFVSYPSEDIIISSLVSLQDT